MSWSVGASGRTSEVRSEIEHQFEGIIKNAWVTDPAELRHVIDTRALLASMLADFSEKTGVDVAATGSYAILNGIKNYSLNLKIQPFWNWQE